MVAKSHRRNWYWNPGCTKSPGCRVVQVLGLAPGTQHYRRLSTEDCLCAEAVGARVCEGNYEKDWREGPKSKENEEYRYKIKHCSSDIHLSQGRGSNIFASCEVTSSLRTSGDLGEGDERMVCVCGGWEWVGCMVVENGKACDIWPLSPENGTYLKKFVGAPSPAYSCRPRPLKVLQVTCPAWYKNPC